LSQALELVSQEELFPACDIEVSYAVRNRRAILKVGYEASESSHFRPHSVGSGDPFQSWWHSFLVNERVSSSWGGDPIRILDLFSSVGGLTLGVSEAIQAMGRDVEVIAGADVDADALASFQVNHRSGTVIHDSVSNLVDMRVVGHGTAARLAFFPEPRKALASLSKRPDVIVAGPPCQGHSTLNNHTRGDDPKNRLYLTVPALAIALDVPVVIIENVPNVVNDKQGVVSSARHLLSSAGYHVTATTLAADKLGWPQTRKRYFMVATKGVYPLELPFLKKLLARKAAPVEWAIGDLEDTLDPNDMMLGQPELSAENRERIQYLVDSGEHDLPLDIRPDCHREGTTYKAVYGRMLPGAPAPTITTGFVTPGRGRFIHPTRPRVLTPREAARIQGFPDWFEFTPSGGGQPSRAMLAKWIGDAVPSLLGFVAGLAAAPSLMK
jgi:DNA (cytosine-5)-methyltransferase 1